MDHEVPQPPQLAVAFPGIVAQTDDLKQMSDQYFFIFTQVFYPNKQGCVFQTILVY